MKLTYTNVNGESISFERTGTFRLLDIQGTGRVDADVQLIKAPFQDGRTRIDSLLEPRTLSLEIGIFADNETHLYQLRRQISRLFNPKMDEGMLKLEYADGVKEIKATPEFTADFPTGNDNKSETFQRMLIELICPNPYWLSITNISEPMANWLGGLSFPLEFNSVGFAERGTKREFINDGDVSAPLTVIFRGEAQNPVIKNVTTGEFIKVNRPLANGDELHITTEFGNKKVEIVDINGNRTNAFNWIDLNSSFFQLIPDKNIVEYSSDLGTEKSTVEVIWRNRYLGI